MEAKVKARDRRYCRTTPANRKSALQGAPRSKFLMSQHNSTAGKQAAMSAYGWGVLSFDGCQRLFWRNPSWRSA